ncbi:MAG: alpha/beta hydrolase [Alphaproteobacteria bacterium]|nr:alpha/beta hydrolase [Alphaproteobacteria bacterium]
MATITTPDGIKLYVEEAGSGTPIVFVHEFAGDWRSWEPQIRHFSRRHRCITYSARGYSPSDIPEDAAFYSQEKARDDILAVMDALKIDRAHIVGLSMGAFATVHFGLAYPERALSLLVAGCGYGSDPKDYLPFKQEAEKAAATIAEHGMEYFGRTYGAGPTRLPFKRKDPRGFEEFLTRLCEHSAMGSSLTMANYQAKRPSLYDFAEGMKNMNVPTLIVNGDEDTPALLPGLFMKEHIPASGMATVSRTGHTINLEEPDLFNHLLETFIADVSSGSWYR